MSRFECLSDRLDDHSFEAAVNENETNWYEALYEAEAARMILYGRALGLSHGEAEDVLQDTFMAFMRLAKAPEHPRHYALRSFRNRALNHKRGLWRRLMRELESRRWFERSPQESSQERAAMRNLARLPQEQREVIVLKIWHRYTFDTIAKLLALSPNTVAGRYRYGLQKLRAQLKETDYETLESLGEPLTLMDAAAPLGPA